MKNKQKVPGSALELHQPEETGLCFRCGMPAVGKTSFLTGTKDGIPTAEYDVEVCEDCYADLKEKVRTRSKLQD